MKFLSKINVKDKKVILRSDLNSNFVDGKVLMSERIKEAAETIKYLKKKKAKVIIIAHQGRQGKEDCVSLKPHAVFLNKFTKVKFVPDLFGKLAKKEIENLKSGEAILLENLRLYKEEYDKRENDLTRNLSSWCDIYVNDAFSCSHREQASMVTLPKKMFSCAGLLLEKELNALKKISVKGAIYLLGGAKSEDNLMLLGKGKCLCSGLFGQMCLIAKGKNLGAQNEYLKKTVEDYDNTIKELKKLLHNVILPVDFGVKVNGKRVDLGLEDFPSKFEIFDIGPKTREIFINEIKKAKSVYMKGPVGDFSTKGFEKGTFEILKAITNSKCFSLIGGGHLSDAIVKFKIPLNKFGYISLSGGALLEYIAGKKLPGLEALK